MTRACPKTVTLVLLANNILQSSLDRTFAQSAGNDLKKEDDITFTLLPVSRRAATFTLCTVIGKYMRPLVFSTWEFNWWPEKSHAGSLPGLAVFLSWIRIFSN